MDNGRKVADNSTIEKTKKYFFEGFSVIENKRSHSNIEDEYKNSISKRNKGLVIILVIFVLVTFLITWFVSETILNRSIDASVNIDNFKELNLAEIVQNIKTSKSKIIRLENVLVQNKKNLEKEIEEIKNKAKKEIESLERKKLGKVKYQESVNTILAIRDKNIKKTMDIFKKEEIKITKEISGLNTQIKVQEEAYTKINYETVDPKKNRQPAPVVDDKNNNLNYYEKIFEQDYYMLIKQSEEYKKEIDNLKKTLQNENNKYAESQIAVTNVYKYIELINKLENENSKLKTQINDERKKLAKLNNENSKLKIQINDEKKKLAKLNDKYISDNRVNAASINLNFGEPTSEKILYYNNLETLLARDKSGAGYVVYYSKDVVKLFISKLYNPEKGERVLIYRGNTFIAELEIISVSEDRLSILAKTIRIAKRERINIFDSVILGGIKN